MGTHMDTKEQIVRYVQEIETLKLDIDEHWSRIQAAIEANRIDIAIPLLKAYFRLKQNLTSVESRLAGHVNANF
jgi:hypothetical protein